MVEKDLRFITDAMIEASGALHVAVTDQNHVINIITKLERAICKARTLESSRLMPLTEALDYSKDLADGVQAEQPPPIPHQDLGKADQSPRSCTCHPDDRPPVPCAEKYAFSECVASIGFDTTDLRPGTVVIGSDGQIQRYGTDPSRNPYAGGPAEQIQSSDQLKEALRASVEFEDDDVPTRRVRTSADTN